MWQQDGRWNEQEGRKRDAIQHTNDDHEAQQRRSQDARALLHLVLAACAATESGPKRAYLVLDNPVYQDQAPAHQQRLDAVGEGVRLEGPCHVRGRDQGYRNASSARRLDQLMDSPVLHDDTQREHEYAQCPVHHRRGDLISEPLPEPAQEVHGPAVCEP